MEILDGKKLSNEIIEELKVRCDELKEKFDESRLPYIVNFTDYHNIDERFYNLIKDDLVSVSEN